MQPGLHSGLVLAKGEMIHQNDRAHQRAPKAKNEDQNNGYQKLTNEELIESLLSTLNEPLVEGHHGQSSSSARSESELAGDDENPGVMLARGDKEMLYENDKTHQRALKAVKMGKNNGYRELTNDEQVESLLSSLDESLVKGHSGTSNGTKSESQRGGEGEYANSKRMAVGTPVYIRDPHYSWIPATIESEGDDNKHVKVRVRLPSDWEDYTVPSSGGRAQDMKLERVVTLTDYGNSSGQLPLQNLEKDGVTVTEKDDIADLANLHMAAILYSLKARHAKSLPYTRVGDIIVAVNPFRWISGLYSEEKQDFYAKNLIWKAKVSPRERIPMDGHQPVTAVAPEKEFLGNEYGKHGISAHVYEISSLAYLGLARDQSDQTVIVTGESGAGKSETIKIVMNHLATVERSRPSWTESNRGAAGGLGSVTVQRILQANPLFESFGNAKTLRNDNSSRFGKFTQLLFEVETASRAEEGGRAVPSCHIAGSKCITYLLEKSRVVSASEGERAFHIFYQLLGAPADDKQKIWECLLGASASDFSYLSNASLDYADSLASGESWHNTVAALSVFGIQGDVLLNVMRSLCVILQLGNIAFDGQLCDGEERAMISTVMELEKLSSIMGIPKADIETALTRRFIATGGEELTIFLNVKEARDGRDALAKEIYARVFDLLVKKCNDATQPNGSANKYGNISLLDIFGFENFRVNSFEQFCINYANEKLQQKYVIDNFEAIILECEEEGVGVFDISLVDNTDVVELLEGKVGLIAQLNEECVIKNGQDEHFVRKFKSVNSNSGHIVLHHCCRQYEFAIQHYAAPTKYDARTFIEKNLDKVPAELLKCARQSSNPLLREEFQKLSSKLEAPMPGAGLRRRSEITKHLVVTKFKDQLTSLMFLIEKSRTRYIRCVKPNKQMAPIILDHTYTVSQLESAGLVTAIVMASESFPNWLSYEKVMDRFGFARKFCGYRLDSPNIKFNAEILLNHLLAGMTTNGHRGMVKPFSCGKTRVYFRAGALEVIETARQDYYAGAATQLQAVMRSCWARHRFLTLKQGIILFQHKVRRWLGHEQHADMSLRLQRWMRSCWTRKKFLTLKQSVHLVQCQIRRWIAFKSYMKTIQRVVAIQCLVRKSFAEKELSQLQKHRASAVIQTRWRGLKLQGEFKVARQAAIRIQCFHRMVMGRKALAVMKKEKDGIGATESRILHEEGIMFKNIQNEILQWQKKISSEHSNATRMITPRKTYRNTVVASSAKLGDIRKPIEQDQRTNEDRSEHEKRELSRTIVATPAMVPKMAEEYFKFCKFLNDGQKELKIDNIIISDSDTLQFIISDSDTLQFFIKQMFESNKFEQQEMAEWQNKMDAGKTWDVIKKFNKLSDVQKTSMMNSGDTIKQSRYQSAADFFTEEINTSETVDPATETKSPSQTSTHSTSQTEEKDSHGASSQTEDPKLNLQTKLEMTESKKFGRNKVSGKESVQKPPGRSYINRVPHKIGINEVAATGSLRDEAIQSERCQLVPPTRPYSSPAEPEDEKVVDSITRNDCHYYVAASPLPKHTIPPEAQVAPSTSGSDSTIEILDGGPQVEPSRKKSHPNNYVSLSPHCKLFNCLSPLSTFMRGRIKGFVLALFLLLSACGTALVLIFHSPGGDKNQNSDAVVTLLSPAVAASTAPSSMPSGIPYHYSTQHPSLRASSSPPTPGSTTKKPTTSPNLRSTIPTSASPISFQQSTLPTNQSTTSPQTKFTKAACHPIDIKITFSSTPIGTGYELIKMETARGARIVDIFFPYKDSLANQPYHRSHCLEEGGYKFKIYDSWGDGLRDGGYVLSCNGVVIARNGQFGYREQTEFALPDACDRLI